MSGIPAAKLSYVMLMLLVFLHVKSAATNSQQHFSKRSQPNQRKLQQASLANPADHKPPRPPSQPPMGGKYSITHWLLHLARPLPRPHAWSAIYLGYNDPGYSHQLLQSPPYCHHDFREA